MIRFELESPITAAPEVVWRDVATMSGVNAELRPFVRLTVPDGCEELSASNSRVMKGFVSWILLFGVVPIDRHDFGFDEISSSSFTERSRSVLNRSWQHDRSIRLGDDAASSVVRDSLIVEARLRAVEPLLRPILRALFGHRHRRLRKRYGAVA